MQNIIGRKYEAALLQEILNSQEAEFVAVYGRRRVGKTFLIREFFQKKGCYVEFTGVKDGNKHQQLKIFTEKLSQAFCPTLSLQPPSDWHSALALLSDFLENQSKSKKIILFFDELPWMAKKKSGLIQAIDYFWNTRWSRWKKFKFIVCGSAASWMLDHLINAKGGLHNRVTRTLLLRPLNIMQTQDFLKSQGIQFKPKQIIDLYLAMGGIPYYLKQVKKSNSVVQNIDRICFQQDGLLYNEFSRLYTALFENPELSMRLMRIIAKHHYGISKEKIVKQAEKTSGGTFDKRLEELEASGFIQRFVPYGNKTREQFFRVIDPYSLFYLSWIVEFSEQRQIAPQKISHWATVSATPSWYNWAGYAFENLCYQHIDNILAALNLTHIPCKIGSWRLSAKHGEEEQKGSQVDLLFDRADNMITLCEIKYSHQPFVIDKDYAKVLANKLQAFERHFGSEKQINFALITTVGLKPNIWSEDLIQYVVTLEDFFS